GKSLFDDRDGPGAEALLRRRLDERDPLTFIEVVEARVHHVRMMKKVVAIHRAQEAKPPFGLQPGDFPAPLTLDDRHAAATAWRAAWSSFTICTSGTA